MTSRGRSALALGTATYLVARFFGSKPLYPVALGLVFLVLVTWLWIRLCDRPLRLRRTVGQGEHLEGDAVPVELRLERSGRLPLGPVAVVERIGRLGQRRTPLERGRGGYVLGNLPRGRYTFEQAQAVLEDPFALHRLEIDLPAGAAVVVYPRLVELDRLFSETGLQAHDGRRLLLRRLSGFDLHSVREYEQGESLRRVHWRSTAKRGQLMVKELEDSPRDEVAVVLDADASAVVDESFDVQVRAAGSILRSHVLSGRRAVLVVNAVRREVQRVHSFDGDWRQALELLAAAEPTGVTPLAALLADEAAAISRTLELAVVTAALSPRLVERLIERALSHRAVSLVYVDPSSFNGVRPRPQPGLLRLQAAGVPVAVLRRGDDLAEQLSAPLVTGAARA
ncbi:MAG: DUF58 domain-containing protein [Gaiellaceae bacterium]